mgnify:CR=1 FL=1
MCCYVIRRQSVISQIHKQKENEMKYSDEVLNAEWVMIKKSTIKAHLISEVCAWTAVAVLVVLFIL